MQFRNAIAILRRIPSVHYLENESFYVEVDRAYKICLEYYYLITQHNHRNVASTPNCGTRAGTITR